MDKYTVVCFGDSLTWGAIPGSWNEEFDKLIRYPKDKRWTGILQKKLGVEIEVVEEGLPARTTSSEDPNKHGRNGSKHLDVTLETNDPVYLVVLMLGINDTKHRYGLSASDISENISSLVKMIRKSKCGPGSSEPKVLIVAPPPLGRLREMHPMFDGGVEKSHALAGYLKEVAGTLKCAFLDTSEAGIKTSEVDGIHLDEKANEMLAEEVSKKVFECLRKLSEEKIQTKRKIDAIKEGDEDESNDEREKKKQKVSGLLDRSSPLLLAKEVSRVDSVPESPPEEILGVSPGSRHE